MAGLQSASIVVLAATLAVSTAACAGSNGLGGSGDPQSVLHAYARALEEGRTDEAYRLLSDEARRGISLEAFRRMVTDDPEGVKGDRARSWSGRRRRRWSRRR